MAEQAQAKLDEVQGQINSKQPGHQGDGPAVEYDKHGRPVPAGRPRRPIALRCAPPPWPDPRRAAHRASAAAPPAAGAGPCSAAPKTPGTPPAEDPNGLNERRSASGLTLRECASCAPTKAC